MIKIKKNISDFGKQVKKKSGCDLGPCLHCTCCSGGCPFSEMMDFHPNRILRMVQFGLKKEVLESSAIWICVGCYTCEMQCPQNIEMSKIMDAIREIAIEENANIAEPGIYNFHNNVLTSIEKYGRTHKFEIMLKYKTFQKQWFSDLDLGIKMFLKGKLDLIPSRVTKIEEIKKIFDKNLQL